MPPAGVKRKGSAEIRRSFDQLQSVGVEQMKWLRAKTKLSAEMQKRIIEQASGRMAAAIGSKCENSLALIQQYRDKCAALVENIAAAQEKLLGLTSQRQRGAAEAAQSAADFAISTCYEPIDNVSRVSSYARMMQWKPLSDDEKNVINI